ncbi:MAG: hypothetical protein ACHQ7M_05275 [Chloroflexota bacterium]
MGNETAALDALRKSLEAPIPDALKKAFTSPSTATSGLAQYDLVPGARLMYPVDSPFRNIIPREVGGAGIQANWRSILGINTNNEQVGLSEGNRGGINSYLEYDVFAKFCELGMDDYATWKAQRAAEGFEQLDELAVQMLLQTNMEAEEKVILYGMGGNSINGAGLGTTPNPTTTPSTSGGTIPNQSGLVTCVALTYRGFPLSSVANGVKIPYTRTNADGSTDTINGFSAAPSSNVAATTTGAGNVNSITATVTAVPGAAGYAWFYGLAGSQLLAAITTINSVSLTAVAAGTQNLTALPATDKSLDSLVYDGLIAQILASGTTYGSQFGSYIRQLATGTAGTGSTLTATGNGQGSINEIDTAIESFFTNKRMIPDTIWLSGIDQVNFRNKVLTGNTNAAPFFGVANDGSIKAGALVKKYLNPTGYGLEYLDVKTHPFLPQGTILFTTAKLPFPKTNTPNIWKMNMRRDYYAIKWPYRSRKDEYGLYYDGLLQHFYPGAMGLISNVANG